MSVSIINPSIKLGKKEQHIHTKLIDRCRENDRKAHYELYEIYYKQMYNTSLRILNNTAEAEDVMQESFLTAFRKLDEYSGEGEFGAWLRRIVVNNAIDVLKKKQPALSFATENLPDMEEPKEDDDDETDYKVSEIKEAMKLLPEDHRAIISLFLFEGYDHEEIAQILRISYNASRTRFSRAKQKLKNVLAEQRTLKTFNPN